MKKFAAIFLSLIFAITLFATPNFPLTTPFQGSGIQGLFPTPVPPTGIEVETTHETTQTDGLNLTQTLYDVSTKDGKAWFGIAVLDYNADLVQGLTELDGSIDGGFKSGGFALVPDSRENTTLVGLFAREAAGVTDANDVFMRVSQNGQARRYIAVVVFNKELHATQKDADEFFNSIKVSLKPLSDRT